MQEKMPKPMIVGILASLFTGLVTLLLLKKKSGTSNKMARKAPQLDLDHRGSQSDFPKPPTISDVG